MGLTKTEIVAAMYAETVRIIRCFDRRVRRA
jgi:hypothetical protein